MRAYLVQAKGRKRYAGTQADARTTRDDFVEELGVKKKEVDIEEVDIPYDKGGMLQFINELCAELDPPKPGKGKGKSSPTDDEDEENNEDEE